MLVAHGENKQLRFTRKRSRELIMFQPSINLLLQDYPLEWSRWLASGIGVFLQDSGLDVALHTSAGKRVGAGAMVVSNLLRAR